MMYPDQRPRKRHAQSTKNAPKAHLSPYPGNASSPHHHTTSLKRTSHYPDQHNGKDACCDSCAQGKPCCSGHPDTIHHKTQHHKSHHKTHPYPDQTHCCDSCAQGKGCVSKNLPHTSSLPPNVYPKPESGDSGPSEAYRKYGRSYRSIAKLENIWGYQRAALYARAVGYLTIDKYYDGPTVGCSSWLLGGPWLATAAHCRTTEYCYLQPWEKPPKVTAPIDFGMYTSRKNAIQNIRERMNALGIPEPQTNKSDQELYTSDLESFLQMTGTTTETQAYSYGYKNQCADVDYLKLETEPIYWSLPRKFKGSFSFDWEETQLYPSDVWGSIPILRDREALNPKHSSFRKDRRFYVLHVNKLAGSKKREVLITPAEGRLVEPFGLIPSALQKPTSHYFYLVNSDWAHGSSGGATIDFDSDRAAGVVSGWGLGGYYISATVNNKAIDLPKEGEDNANTKELIYIDNPIRRQSTQASLFSPNIYLGGPQKTISPKSTQTIKNASIETEILPYIPATRFSNWAGLRQDRHVQAYNCPKGYVSAGLIGSSVFTPHEIPGIESQFWSKTDYSFAGNLGTVCLPYRDEYEFYHAKVSASGSIATNHKQAFQMPFNEYYPSSLYLDAIAPNYPKSKRDPQAREISNLQFQKFGMCAPGYFMTGIKLLLNKKSRIQSIEAIDCVRKNPPRNWKRVSYYERPFVDLQSKPIIGEKTNTSLTEKHIHCPDGYVVDGIELSKEPITGFPNAVRLRCRKIRK